MKKKQLEQDKIQKVSSEEKRKTRKWNDAEINILRNGIKCVLPKARCHPDNFHI